MKWLDRALVVLPHYFGLCLNVKDFQRELKSLGIPKARWPEFLSQHGDAAIHHFEKGDGKLCAIVALGERKGRSVQQIHALLVHEAVHLWQDCRRVLGEQTPSAEFEAYAVQSISQRLMEACDELTAKKKKARKK